MSYSSTTTDFEPATHNLSFKTATEQVDQYAKS